MEICNDQPRPRPQLTSVIEIKNKIRAGHSECCNCCCCSKPVQYKAYKYIQPPIPKSFRPVRKYVKEDVPLENSTTYKLSFWPNPTKMVKPILPQGNLTFSTCPITDDTTHKMSYMGNWGIEPQKKLEPCRRNWFGRGPLLDVTTQKHDFVWKASTKADPIKYPGQLCIPRGHVADATTYKLSFYESNNVEPIPSYRPVREYVPTEAPLEECTTYRLSYHNGELPEKELYPWKPDGKYKRPVEALDDHTTYKLSFWPHGNVERREPIKHQGSGDPINKDDPIECNTTYNLSYFAGAAGDMPAPILPRGNIEFVDCPLSHDTINKMSYLGNWEPKPEKPIVQCTRQLLGRGPIESCTTQKDDFGWKCSERVEPIPPRGNLDFSTAPIEDLTTNQLSYMPTCPESLTPTESFRPVRQYEPTDMPMACDTTMQISYQPPEQDELDRQERPWATKPAYHHPTTPIDENTTYNMSYNPPGLLIPVSECCEEEAAAAAAQNSSNPCSMSVCPRAAIQESRPCISC
ncbi:stabilizer of axonemal microtubules 1-like [Trichogramma pretiosum]|uniref:stabilizer of axonemal microtubules 1-like n=1 Tax=Trichogramma pretiosum TaxID=7493 RepID=UPI0006C968AB|nr:stabilizer of axonemal microtubules 1-like [Trichogramma pretiosum]